MLMTNTKDDLLELIYECPAEIAYDIGYDRLTSLHNEWIRMMVFGEGDETIQGHRGSFKTTCLIVAFAYLCVVSPELRTIFLRKTDTDVAEVMTATANLLQTPYFNDIARELYGCELVVTKATYSVVSTNLVQGVSGAPQILGLGLGSSITGKHADRVFTDDIVNVKDRVSPAERERTKLVYQELQNIKNRGGRIFNTGTPWHVDDCFSLMPNPQKWDCYSTGLMSEEEIDHLRQSMTRSLFCANYELKHVADEDAMFTDPQYFDDFELLRDGVAHIDAAYGGADGTALTVIKKHKQMFYVYGRLWQKPVDKVLPDIMTIVKALKAGTIYSEKNADKGYLRRDILNRFGHPAANYSEHENKFIKISTYLKGAWKNVRFLDCDQFPLDAEYINQILEYSEHAMHDDAPDSLASIIRQLDETAGVKGMRNYG